jgi:hypothetical protein
VPQKWMALRAARYGWSVFPLHWVDHGECSCPDPKCNSAGKHQLPIHDVKTPRLLTIRCRCPRASTWKDCAWMKPCTRWLCCAWVCTARGCHHRPVHRSAWWCPRSTGSRASNRWKKIRLVASQPQNIWNISNAHECGFYSNVNPHVDHSRWSQGGERRLGELRVAKMYAGMDLKKDF